MRNYTLQSNTIGFKLDHHATLQHYLLESF